MLQIPVIMENANSVPILQENTAVTASAHKIQIVCQILVSILNVQVAVIVLKVFIVVEINVLKIMNAVLALVQLDSV